MKTRTRTAARRRVAAAERGHDSRLSLVASRHREYLGVACPTCGQDSLPLPDGTCGWCDTTIVKAAG